MNHQPKSAKLQLNLELRQPAPTEVPAGKERELALALAELLLTAAEELAHPAVQAETGGDHESKVNS
jgi:hypothetical protein